MPTVIMTLTIDAPEGADGAEVRRVLFTDLAETLAARNAFMTDTDEGTKAYVEERYRHMPTDWRDDKVISVLRQNKIRLAVRRALDNAAISEL